MRLMRLLWIVGLLVWAGCAPSSLEEFRKEGRRLNQELLEMLQPLQSREDVAKVIPRLQKLFSIFVEETIAAREYQERHPQERIPDLNEVDRRLSAALRKELHRLYLIEGVREMIEKSQENALHRLDAFEQKQNKVVA